LAIDFYFVGRPQRLPAPHKLFSKRSFIVDVSPSYLKRLSLCSDVLRSSEVRYATLGKNYTSGYEIEGWILFARLPGKAVPFDKVSSNKAMLEHLEWFPAALQEFERNTHTRPDYAPEVESEPTPAVANGGAAEPSARIIVVRPSPPAAAASATAVVATATKLSPPAIAFVTVTKPTKVTVGRGQETIQPGTKLPLIARAPDVVQVRYKGESAFINIASTDLK
jgi:hypothetical protein